MKRKIGKKEIPEGNNNIFTHLNQESSAHNISNASQGTSMLKETNRRLEAQVKERTADLASSNQELKIEIAERKHVEFLLRESETRRQAIFDLVPCGIMLVEAATHKIKDINNLGREMFGAPIEEILDRECHHFICPAEKGSCPITDLRSKVYQEEKKFIKKNGEGIIVLKSISLITIEGTEYLLESFIDISERKKTDAMLNFYSMHDHLTGLYNRNYYEEELDRLKKASGSTVGMMICDVDGLKIVNDTMGHDRGDQLLRTASRVLIKSFPGGTMIARIGGDEFVIIISPCTENTLEQSYIALRRQLDQANKTNEIQISIAIGFAVGTIGECDIELLAKQADDNMYHDKILHHKSSTHVLVHTLRSALAERDFITGGHADRMQQIAERFGLGLNLSERKIMDLNLLAQFHDVGKVGIPDAILFKPAALSPEEKEIMQQHSEIGYRIAESASILSDIGDLILKHHEWWNGEGYPLGIKGKEIPLECRIIAIIDAYDAMTSDRPYRKTIPVKSALDELKRLAGIQFDPELVSYFIALIEHDGIGAQ